jgi:hypothetical protein
MAMQFAKILADEKVRPSLGISAAARDLRDGLQGYISTSHMKWFMEAEGSRNYEDEAAMNELLRKLDTNGDGKVCACTPPPPHCLRCCGAASQLCRLIARNWQSSSRKSRRD